MPGNYSVRTVVSCVLLFQNSDTLLIDTEPNTPTGNDLADASRRRVATAFDAMSSMESCSVTSGIVVLFDSWDRHAWADFAELNAALLDTVAREQPDVMLFVPMLAEVWLETLEIIKARGDVISICWTKKWVPRLIN